MATKYVLFIVGWPASLSLYRAAERAWWRGMRADRILHSALAGQLPESGLATPEDLHEISDAWKEWAASKDGWISILHGELIYRVIPAAQ